MFVLVIYWYNKVITELKWSNKKRALLVAGAVVFLVVLFFIKNGTLSKKNLTSALNGGENSGSTILLQDLINRDTDGDGVLDWEESLWGTDPTKKDTDDDGILDGVEIARLKSESTANREINTTETQNLTKTDEFSRELFSTIATLNQAGQIDQATIDKLGSSLAEQIENVSELNVYLLGDLKTIQDSGIQAIKNYNDKMGVIFGTYQGNEDVLGILEKLIIDDNTTDVAVLSKLDPIIKQTQKIVNEMLILSVPAQLSQAHLNVINKLQAFSENIKGIQLYEKDPILALRSMGQYEDIAVSLELEILNLKKVIWEKLNR